MLMLTKISGYIPPFVKIGKITTLGIKIYYIYVIGRCNGDSVPCAVQTEANGTADQINTRTVAYRI